MAARGSGRRAAINAARSLKRQAHGPVGLLEQWRPSQDGTSVLVLGFGVLGTGTLGDTGLVKLGSTTLDSGDLLGEYPAEATTRLGYYYVGREGHLS